MRLESVWRPRPTHDRQSPVCKITRSTSRIALVVRSLNKSSGRYAASVTANSECGQQVGSIAFFENLSDENNTCHELNESDATRGYIPDQVSEFPVARLFFDPQPHTHHIFYSCFFL